MTGEVRPETRALALHVAGGLELHREQIRGALREALGEESLDAESLDAASLGAAWEAGQQLATAEAARLALDDDVPSAGTSDPPAALNG